MNKLILFWMHRCGSTTGQLWFFNVAGWAKRMKGKGASQLAPEWMAEHHAAYADLESHYRDPSYVKVAVVRDPLARAVSAFSVVTDTKSGSQWRAVSRSIAAPDDRRRITFNEFLDFLEISDLAASNYHWRLQTAQDWYDLKLPDVQFARVETLQADLDRICRRMGKKPVAMRMNSAQTKIAAAYPKLDVTEMVRADFARLFGHDRRGIIQFPEFSRFLTERTVPRPRQTLRPRFRGAGLPGESRLSGGRPFSLRWRRHTTYSMVAPPAPRENAMTLSRPNSVRRPGAGVDGRNSAPDRGKFRVRCRDDFHKADGEHDLLGRRMLADREEGGAERQRSRGHARERRCEDHERTAGDGYRHRGHA